MKINNIYELVNKNMFFLIDVFKNLKNKSLFYYWMKIYNIDELVNGFFE